MLGLRSILRFCFLPHIIPHFSVVRSFRARAKNGRILGCILFAESLYAVLVYLGIKLEYTGILIFFGLIIALTVGIYIVSAKNNYVCAKTISCDKLTF